MTQATARKQIDRTTPVDSKSLRKLRIDQIGSLVAPNDLRVAFAKFAEGEISEFDLTAAQDKAILAVIQSQENIGLPIITDGEFRRFNFQDSFSAAVGGFDVPDDVVKLTDWQEPNKPLHRTEQNFDAAGPAILTRRPVIERVHLKRNLIRDEYIFAANTSALPIKVSLIGPDRIIQRFAWERSRGVYADLDEFIADIVAIERRMIAELIAAGCKYVHVDAPGFTAYVDPISIDRMQSRGEDPQQNLDRAIQAENEIIENFSDVVFGLHICRGNVRGIDPVTGKVMPQWHREGAYDEIAEKLFSSLRHDRLLLEYDSERSGGFEPLRFVPSDKIVVIGIVSTKSEDVETVDEIIRKVDAAARYIPYERLAISPQCGFSSGVGHIQIPEDLQWRKFEVLINAVEKIWGSD